MLSIGAMGGGQGTYYVGLAREDYYLEGGEPPGQWVGQGSVTLGLTGQVERDQFLHLFAGVDERGVALVQNAGDPKRQPGWDLTFSAPKSVSTLWAICDGEMRRAIQDAHFAAVKSALKTMEAGATTRRGKGGSIKEAAQLLIATFEHGTSRAQDPQLHTHALILNIGLRADGTTGTLESQNFYRSKMAVGALYRAELAAQMQRLGFQIERDGSSFRIVGVPPALQEEFSKRRAEIEALLGAKGKDSARAAAVTALETRQVKEHIAREDLFAGWQDTGAQHAFTQEDAARLKAPIAEPSALEREKALRAVMAGAIEKMSRDQSHFGERELLRWVAEDAQGRGISADEVRAAVGREVRENTQLIALGEHKGETRYTTRELWEIEKALLQSAARWSTVTRHQVGHQAYLKGILEAERNAARRGHEADPATSKAGQGTPMLSDEQRAALSHLTKDSGGVALLSGMAGTGKTFLLEAAREAWEAQGFTVKGAAIAGKAARGLQDGAGIQSSTIARLLHPRSQIALNERTILVIDEAGMVGTRHMAALLAAVERSGAKLVLVGDARQLQPIDVGGPLRALENRLGCATLTGIIRQKEAWARQAVRDFADGRGAKALRAFEARGLLTVADDRESAKISLIRSWQKVGVGAPQQNVIFAGTRAEVKDLNRLAQDARQSAGKLGFRTAKVGNTLFHEKDRVVFTEGSYTLGVQNGNMGTVQEIDASTQTLTVKLDSGTKVFVPYDAYQELSLGYALTTHKGQGMTAKNAFVLCGGSMADREISYVQASRASDKTELFTEKIVVWNPDTQKREEATLPELGRRMSQSRQKDMAHDIKQPDSKQKPQAQPPLEQQLEPQLSL